MYREKLKTINNNKPTLERLAELFHGMEPTHTYVSTERIDLDFETTKQAREVTNYILDNTEIDRFDKSTESRYEGLWWYYFAKLNGVEVRVGPAPPDRRCKPVKKEYTNSYWVCEPKENLDTECDGYRRLNIKKMLEKLEDRRSVLGLGEEDKFGPAAFALQMVKVPQQMIFKTQDDCGVEK